MPSGYDFSYKNPYRLLQGRLGVYGKDIQNPGNEQSKRLRGKLQQERMICDKRRSLARAVWNSYQAAEVIKTTAADRKPARALINPNILKQDYDDKIISVDFDYNISVGDVIEWVGTNTYWLIYLQDLTELAYFKGDMRKCSYEIAWEDEGEIYSTYAAIKGPVETRIATSQKHGIALNTPNFSLSLLLPKTEEVLKYFKRYSKFYLQNEPTCWRVEGLDWLSTPGILEVTAVEYYANEDEDDIEAGIVGGLIEEPKSPNTPEQESQIIGETFIEVKTEYTYRFSGSLAAMWKVDSKLPIELRVSEKDPRIITVKWLSSYCGQFDLCYGKFKKTIVVESLF